MTVTAQRTWAKNRRNDGAPISGDLLRETTTRLYMKALSRLEGFGDDKLMSEKAAFTTFWMKYLILDAGSIYASAARALKTEANLPESEPKSAEPAAYGALDSDQTALLLHHLRRSVEWLTLLEHDDQVLAVAYLVVGVREAGRPSNSKIYQALHGEDTPARAGAQAIGKRLHHRKPPPEPLLTLIRRGLLAPMADVDPGVRATIVHTAVDTVRDFPVESVPTPTEFITAATAATDLLEQRLLDADKPNVADDRDKPTTEPDGNDEEQAS